MEATITTLGDAFKQKVEDSIVVPTIWVDKNGIEHEDWVNTAISVTPYWPGNNALHNSTFSDYLVCDGDIKQVGSHVISCGLLCKYSSIYSFDLSKTFAYAKNLKEISGMFIVPCHTESPFEIPEDLFWGCPKLTIVDGIFSNTNINSIPFRLFEKCPDLTSVKTAFSGCTFLRTIPGDLFRNNPKLYSLEEAFSRSGVTEVPKTLLEPLVKGKKWYSLNLNRVLYGTPFSRDVVKVSQKLTLYERIDHLEQIRMKYFPDQISLDDIDRMTAATHDFRLQNPYHCTSTLANRKI